MLYIVRTAGSFYTLDKAMLLEKLGFCCQRSMGLLKGIILYSRSKYCPDRLFGTDTGVKDYGPIVMPNDSITIYETWNR